MQAALRPPLPPFWGSFCVSLMPDDKVLPRRMQTIMKRTNRAVAAGFVLIVLSCGLRAQTTAPNGDSQAVTNGDTAGQSLPDASRGHNSTYIIGDDDQLAIDVWKEPELSKTVPVRSDGRISIPLIGELQAAGRTPLQLEQDITSRLRSFITEPSVTVIVQEMNSRKYNVVGQVMKPGSYPLTSTTRVMDAIAMAGGFKDFARKKSVRILHANADGTESRSTFNYEAFIKGKDPQRNIRLQPGDTVVVN